MKKYKVVFAPWLKPLILLCKTVSAKQARRVKMREKQGSNITPNIHYSRGLNYSFFHTNELKKGCEMAAGQFGQEGQKI